MEAAGQRLAAARRMLDQPGAAVAADVVEGAHLTVVVARHHQRGVQRRHVDHDVVVLVRQIGHAGDWQPGAAEDAVDLAGVELGRQPVEDADTARNRLKSPRNWVWVISFMETSCACVQNGGNDPCALVHASVTGCWISGVMMTFI